MEDLTGLQYLDADPRPTIVIDLVQQWNGQRIEPCYTNIRWKSHGDSPDSLLSFDLDQDPAFRKWMTSSDAKDIGRYPDSPWFAYTIEKRFRVLQHVGLDSSKPRRSARKAASASSSTATNGTLTTLTSKSTDVENRFARLLRIVSVADVGVFEYSPNGKLVQANDAFYELSGHPRDPEAAELSFMDTIHPEDRDLATQQWARVGEGKAVTFELRYKPGTKDLQNAPDPGVRWVVATCVPLMDTPGVVTAITGCITDINSQKAQQRGAIERAAMLERARVSEQRFTRFAELANVAIYILSPDLKLQYCNDAWFSVTGQALGPLDEIDWGGLILEEDAPIITDALDSLMATKQSVNFQFRLKKMWTSLDNVASPTWINASTWLETNEDGSVKNIMGTMIDVSNTKWAERLQEIRTDEAVEAKRQQENFIDMTSHEIRNPLGAVVHCADAISSSLVEIESLEKRVSSNLDQQTSQQLRDAIETCIDATNTIISCSNHQTRIVDDILTLSKLDSNLLKIATSATRPSSILADVRKMFEVDARKAGVNFSVKFDKSSTRADWVLIDTGRLMQVLINLVTNAIKFTRQEERQRDVEVSMSIMSEKPTSADFALPVEFVPTSLRDRGPRGDDLAADEDCVFLVFSIRDTGCGLTAAEMGKLFTRFTQASVKTHTKYGGSGLGLFISRELVELQGGGIGVGSVAGSGSTFVFFINAQLIEAPNSRHASMGGIRGDASSQSRSSPPASKWSQAEELRLKQMKDHGVGWAEIAKSFPFKTEGSIKKHWQHLYDDLRTQTTDGNLVRRSIMIVEDNIVNQQVLSKQLRKLGHDVIVASHGAEALEHLRKSVYWRGHVDTATPLSVVLMDVEMPIMDGLTCTRNIRQLERNGEIERHVPIIAMSANARTEQVEHALACGMDDAICKPFRIVDLVAKIERIAR